jgi:hypothetical protein
MRIFLDAELRPHRECSLQHRPGGGVTLRWAKHGAMTEHQTSRTLVKSSPELWAECSDAASLARHLGAFGEIRITKLEPETAVAWEGAAVRGTVRLEPSGWGTRVTLTVTKPAPDTSGAESEVTGSGEEPEPVLSAEALEIAVAVAAAAVVDADAEAAQAAAEPEPVAEPEPARVRPGMLARLLLSLRRKPAPDPAPEVQHTAVQVPVAASAALVTEPAFVPAGAVTEPAVPSPDAPAAVRQGEDALAAALDSLGRAHHRPYSRT